MVSTLARTHPKGTVPLILASQTSLVKLQPVPKSLHMNRDLTVLESQKGGSALSIFCCLITHLCCERATATLTKPETSEMKMMTRRGYQRCRAQRQKHLDRRPLRPHLPSRKRPH